MPDPVRNSSSAAHVPVERSLIGASGRRVGGLLALVVLVLVALVSAGDLRPPAPQPESAPADQFSAVRAAARLPGFAAEPRALGTPAGERARDHLIGQLRDLGLDPEVQRAMAQSPLRSGYDGSVLVGHVENVVAVLPGADSTGRVFLVAHYDSTMNSPGAADNGAAVVSILEAVRAVQAGPALRNDVVVVFTDGEEPGMLGAAAFVREHPLARGGGVVLNLEAGGSHGPSTLFETSVGHGCLIDAYAAVPHPFGDSATVSFYEMTSHNTDLAVFTAAGFTGLNSAFFHGSTDYHTPQDSIANLSPASLQHHGANLLSLTRTFGATDLGSAATAECGGTVFFTALGGVVRYPAWFALPLASVGLLALVAALVISRRRQLATLPRVLAGFGAALVPMLLSSAAAYGLWQLLVTLRPGYADLGMGDPYRAELYRWAIITLSAAVIVGWYAALRGRIGPTALALGALGWPAVFGVVTAWLVPGASFLLMLPTLGAAFGVLVALLVPHRRWWWRLVAVTAGACATVFFLPQLVWELLSSSGGIASGAMVAFLIALLAFPLLPLLELAFPQPVGAAGPDGRRQRVRELATSRGTVLTVALLLVSAGLTGTGLAVDRFDAEHPRPAHLHYVLDGDTQVASWVSRDQQPSAWTCGFVDCTADRGPGASAVSEPFPWVGSGPVRTGTARSARLDAPELTVLEDRVERDSRVVTVRVRSPRTAAAISLYVDQPVTEATVAGLQLTDPTAPAHGPWAFGLDLHAPPAAGVHVTLRLGDPGAVQMRIVDHSYGLDGIPGFTPRPAAIGVAMAPSDVVSVGHTALVDRTTLNEQFR